MRGSLGGVWWSDISPDLNIATLMEFLLLGDLLAVMHNGVEDRLVWAWENDHQFSASSEYHAFFAGRITWPSARTIWRSRAPMNCKVFGWLEWWRMPHPATCSCSIFSSAVCVVHHPPSLG